MKKRNKRNHKYHYFYKITNLLTEEYYYGIHSTSDLNDGYMGSGHVLKNKIKEFGIENFKKDILKFFDSREECGKYEKEIVTIDVVNDPKCYNMVLGGDYGNTKGMIAVKDPDGNCLVVDKNDKRYLSGYLTSNMTGLLHVIDNDGNHITITTEEYYKNKNLYKSHTLGKVLARDKDNNIISIPKEVYDELKQNNEIKGGQTAGYGVYKDKFGNSIQCRVDDENVLNGTYVGYTKGLTIYKYKNDFSKTCYTTKDDPRVKSGELVGINYGIVYCINPSTGEKLKLSKDDYRLKSGEFITILKWKLDNNLISHKSTKAIKHNAEFYKTEYPDLSKLILEGKTNTEIIENTKYTNSKFITRVRKILLSQ